MLVQALARAQVRAQTHAEGFCRWLRVIFGATASLDARRLGDSARYLHRKAASRPTRVTMGGFGWRRIECCVCLLPVRAGVTALPRQSGFSRE